MNFENGMTCEIMFSNGIHTVGYVNGKAAEWVGNNEPLTEEKAFRLIKNEGSTIIFSKQNFSSRATMVENTKLNMSLAGHLKIADRSFVCATSLKENY